NGALQVERLDERRKVVGIRVQVVAIPGLARAAVATPIVRDAAVAARGEEEHLVFERLCAERPAVAEDDRLTGSPVVVVEPSSVLRRDRAHPDSFPSSKNGAGQAAARIVPVRSSTASTGRS